MINADLNSFFFFFKENCLHGFRKQLLLLYPTQDMLKIAFSFPVLCKTHHGRFFKCLRRNTLSRRIPVITMLNWTCL